MPSSSITII